MLSSDLKVLSGESPRGALAAMKAPASPGGAK